jgi:aspartate ammonia-lyase
MPLLAHSLLESIDLLTNASAILRLHCVQDLKANEEQCRKNVLNSTALITAVIPVVGYEKASKIVKKAKEEQMTIRDAIVNSGLINEQVLNELISPEAVCRLGFK